MAKVTRSNRVGRASFPLFYRAICAIQQNSSACAFARVSNLTKSSTLSIDSLIVGYFWLLAQSVAQK
jgi:hypothetical protein